MGKPGRSEPAASDSARLATNSDLPTFGSPPTNRMPCGRQQSGFHQAGRRGGRLLLQKLGQRQDAGLGVLRACGGAHSSASLVASSRIASFTVEALRAAARRRAVMASLLTLRGMPLVA